MMSHYAQQPNRSSDPGWPAPHRPPSLNPPYSGPPPVPQGMNPQHWAAGYWQYNPTWNIQRYNPNISIPGSATAPWAPGYGWGASEEPSASYNPYKRVPKPPSPSYWREPLSANSLGLENMVPRKDRPENADESGSSTPWIWNPPGLVHGEAEEEPPITNLELRSRQNSFENPAREGLDPQGSGNPRRHSHEYGSPTALAPQKATPPSHPTSTANYQKPRSLEHHSSHPSLASDRTHNSWPDPVNDRRDALNRQHHQSSTTWESRPSPLDQHEERRESRHHHHQHHHQHHSTLEQPPIQRDSSGERVPGERRDSHPNYYSGSSARERQAQPDPPDRRATDPYLHHNSAPREQMQTQQDSSERHGADHYSFGSVPREQRQVQQEHTEHQDMQHRQHHGSTAWEQRSAQKDTVQSLIETFTSKTDLQTTFSPNIVRTPGHYRPLARHDSHEEFNKRESPTRTESRQASAPLSDGRIPGLGRPKTKTTSIPQRQSSMPNVAISSLVPDSFASLPNFVDEPSNVAALSPLVNTAPRTGSRAAVRSQSDPSHGQTPQARPQARSQTDSHVGASLGTINENTREGHASRDAFRPAPSTSSSRPSPTSSWKLSPNTNSSPTTNQHSSLYQNPLPRPPQETHNPAASAPLPPRIPPPPGTWKLRVRRGFWNRRGDFLTRDGFIVYAPEDRAYPAELKHYPEDAYVNETGDRVECDPSRPELPESLPQRGRPPTQPYDAFVQYEYLS